MKTKTAAQQWRALNYDRKEDSKQIRYIGANKEFTVLFIFEKSDGTYTITFTGSNVHRTLMITPPLHKAIARQIWEIRK